MGLFRTSGLIKLLIVMILARPLLISILQHNQRKTGRLSTGSFDDVGIFSPSKEYLKDLYNDIQHEQDLGGKIQIIVNAIFEILQCAVQLYGQQGAIAALLIIFIFNYKENVTLFLESLGLGWLLRLLALSEDFQSCDDDCLEHELPDLDPPHPPPLNPQKEDINGSHKKEMIKPKSTAPRPDGWLTYDSVFGVIPEETQKQWEESAKRQKDKYFKSNGSRQIPPVRSLTS
mmetsp:Transcript_2931/g.3836  ORF Transcript_2931/g.3836 Transcript_2931/m.3836 type:complete len:231 (-) Transcript_2931:169-861(-)